WWLIFIMITGMILFVRKIKKIPKGRYLIDKLLLFLPVIGPLVKKLAVARFARTLGSLLENGVTMLTALGIVKNIVGNVLISDAIEKAAKQVEQGHGLGISLDASKIFPHISIQMIQVGEQSGKLETLLNKVSDLYESDVESSVSTMTSLLEPVVILVMGIIVGFIVLSICLPIFEMNQLVK
ncbi:MAG: type II secretion system F family protein, partial [Deltaproteobacteria bacterium]|nr:type II secretion system F family protein [Deltaproteobacteria bacterium]MBW2011894.1 type II secretion system F family protein [Deltaproteobacteria bacterium]